MGGGGAGRRIDSIRRAEEVSDARRQRYPAGGIPRGRYQTHGGIPRGRYQTRGGIPRGRYQTRGGIRHAERYPAGRYQMHGGIPRGRYQTRGGEVSDARRDPAGRYISDARRNQTHGEVSRGGRYPAREVSDARRY